MKVTVELYNDKPLSVKVPKHVTCVVKEAQTPVRGTAQAPKYVFIVNSGFASLLVVFSSSICIYGS